MLRHSAKYLSVFALLLPFAIAPAQDLGAIMRDDKLPGKIKPSELGDDMRAVKITLEKGGNDFMSMMMSPLVMLGGLFRGMGGEATTTTAPNSEEAAAARFFEMVSMSWTNGSTYKLYGQEYLVTYAPQFDLMSLSQSKTPPDVSKMDLVLTLVNTDSITSIVPKTDMTKAEWLKAQDPVAPRESALQTESVSNLKQLSLATLMYASDYDDVVPYVQSTKGAFVVMEPYFKNRTIARSLHPQGGEIRMNMAVAGVNLTTIENPAEMPLFYESKPWSDGKRAVAYVDGHVKRVDPEEWKQLERWLSAKLAKSGKPLPLTLGSGWSG